jgi:hypothetical protein
MRFGESTYIATHCPPNSRNGKGLQTCRYPQGTRIEAVTEIMLPEAFTDTDEFRGLTEPQIQSFKSRLDYVREIIHNIEEWLTTVPTVESFRDFLSELELDLAVNQNLPRDNNREAISSWLIHDSWTFETNSMLMKEALSNSVVAQLDKPTPSINANLTEFCSWLAGQCEALREATDKFCTADSFTAAIAHYLAMDVILANLLVGTYKARLNPALSA